MPSLDERIEALNAELQDAVKKHNDALTVMNQEKERAFSCQERLKLLEELKNEAEGNTEAVTPDVA
tara:strand:- start:1123 stop:1320 length:198 start_codon:yes stop_codon:yes gene_type:complete